MTEMQYYLIGILRFAELGCRVAAAVFPVDSDVDSVRDMENVRHAYTPEFFFFHNYCM